MLHFPYIHARWGGIKFLVNIHRNIFPLNGGRETKISTLPIYSGFGTAFWISSCKPEICVVRVPFFPFFGSFTTFGDPAVADF